MLFTADSSRVLVAEWAGRCRWFKLPSGEPAGGFNLGPPPAGRKHNFYGVTADGAAVAYNGPFEQKDGTPAPGVLDGATGKWTQTFKQHFFASEVSLSADGRRAAVLRDAAATECEFEVVDVKTGEGLVQVRFTGRDIPTAALTPDGTGLIVHDPATDKVRLFDVPDRRPR